MWLDDIVISNPDTMQFFAKQKAKYDFSDYYKLDDISEVDVLP